MTAKEFLSQAIRVDEKINSKREQIERLHEMATQTTSHLTGMPGSSTPDHQKMASAVALAADLKKELEADIDALERIKYSVLRIIWKVDNKQYQMLLELHYIDFKTWEDVADAMDLGLRWVKRLHGKALAIVDKMLRNEQ